MGRGQLWWFTERNLIADFSHSGGEFLNLLLLLCDRCVLSHNLLLLLRDGAFQSRDCALLFCDVPMLFEELVEQHRVHRFVAHCVGLALSSPSHQVGVYFFHFLGHQPKLRDALGIKFLLVAESDWFECEDRFARLIHRFDCVLEIAPRRKPSQADRRN